MALSPKFRNWLRTLGAPEDPVATDTTSEWSAMSLLKAIYQGMANGTFISSIVFAAESYALQAQRSALLTLNYMKQARQSAAAAAADASTTAGHSVVTKDASGMVAGNALLGQRVRKDSAVAAAAASVANIVAGQAMLGQRAKKDRVAAAASAAAAAASAASVTPESLILPNQIFS